MKKFFSFLSVAAALALASCSSKKVNPEEAAQRLVAGEAPAFIVSVKAQELLDKGGLSSKENIPAAFQLLFNDQIEYFTNPGKIGLDVSGRSFIGASSDGKKTSVWVLTGIKDKEAFEKMMKDEGSDKFEELEGYNTVKKDKALMAWNDRLFIMTFVSEGDVKEKFKSYAALLGENKAAGDQYKKFFDAKTDIAFFSDLEQSMKMQETMPDTDPKAAEMIKKAADRFKGSYGLTTLNFENDKVVADIENMLSEAAKKELSFMGNSGFPKELLANLGSTQLTGFFSLNADLGKMVEWAVALSGQENPLDEISKELGLDANRIIGSFSGNLLMAYQGSTKVAFPNFDEDGNLVPSTDSIPQPRVTVIAGLTNNYPQQLADSLLADKKENGYFVMEKGFNAQYLGFKPSALLFTNDFRTITGTGTPALSPEAEKVIGKPFSFYFDLNRIIMENVPGGEKIAEKFKYTSGGFDINGGHAELILNNGGKNSLWTIINMGMESTTQMMPAM